MYGLDASTWQTPSKITVGATVESAQVSTDYGGTSVKNLFT